MAKAALKGKGPLADMAKRFAADAEKAADKAAQAAEKKRVKFISELQKEVDAFEVAEKKKAAIAEREGDRIHRRHRARQRSIAMQNRTARAEYSGRR